MARRSLPFSSRCNFSVPARNPWELQKILSVWRRTGGISEDEAVDLDEELVSLHGRKVLDHWSCCCWPGSIGNSKIWIIRPSRIVEMRVASSSAMTWNRSIFSDSSVMQLGQTKGRPGDAQVESVLDQRQTRIKALACRQPTGSAPRGWRAPGCAGSGTSSIWQVRHFESRLQEEPRLKLSSSYPPVLWRIPCPASWGWDAPWLCCSVFGLWWTTWLAV